MIDKLLDIISQTLLVIGAILGFGLAFLVCADVIGRVAFNSPVKGTPEMVSFAIVIICYLQASYAIRSGGMIAVDAITMHLPYRMQSVLSVVGSLLGAFLFGLIVWGSIDGTLHAWNSGEFEGEGSMRVPVWPSRLVIIIGCSLACISYFLLALKQLGRAVSGGVPITVSSSH